MLKRLSPSSSCNGRPYAARERGRIGAHYKIDDTARVTLAWGLCAANAMSEGRASIWAEILLALREVALMDPSFSRVGRIGEAIHR